jgi:hypothetical protein
MAQFPLGITLARVAGCQSCLSVQGSDHATRPSSLSSSSILPLAKLRTKCRPTCRGRTRRRLPLVVSVGSRGARREQQRFQKQDALRLPAEPRRPGGNSMTAEIAILNKNGVALAADSKVTIGGSGQEKTFDTVNKLFTLSKIHPIGVMIFGNAEFMRYPWETIVKLFRRLGAGCGSERWRPVGKNTRAVQRSLQACV